MPAQTELELGIRLTNPQALNRLVAMHRRLGSVGSRGFDDISRSAKDAGQSIDHLGKFGKFAFDVMQAFLLYKGFVFLKTQAEEFTRELVHMEHQIALTQTQLNSLGRDFQGAITRQMIDIAQDTGIALTELAETQYEVVSANIEVGDSFRVVELTAQAAVAGGLDNASIAFNAALTQANAFKIALADMNVVYDKQFNLVKRGIFTYQQYAQVSGEIAIAFSQIGQDVNVANAALAAVSQIFTGPQLREGATGLKNAALALVENGDAFERMGFQIHDAEGNFRNFIDIVNELESAFSGMSEQERESILLELFDEKRARRGIQALLREVDSLNQFYVEQTFAMGDMNEAYETVNESLLTQARIFKNELIPAAEPMVRILDDLLSGLNAVGNAVGGLDNLAIMFAGVAGGGVLGAARKHVGMAAVSNQTLRVPHPILPPTIMGGSTAYRMPLPSMATAGVGALGGMLAFNQGRQSGELDTADFMTTVGGATLGGAMFGGPMGAATFGGMAALGLVLGELLEEEAPPVAKSFAESFREALVAESERVGSDFASAVGPAFERALGDAQDKDSFANILNRNVLFGMEAKQRVDFDTSLGEKIGIVAKGIFGGGNLDDGKRLQGYDIQNIRIEGLEDLIRSGRLSGVIKGADEASRRAEGLEMLGISADEARAIAIQEGVKNLVEENLVGPSADAASALEGFADIVVRAGLTQEQQIEGLDILTRGFEEIERGSRSTFSVLEDFNDYLRKATSVDVGEAALLTTRFNATVKGDLTPLINTFDEIGKEGHAVAEAFREVEKTMERFDRFQSLLNIKFQTQIDTLVPGGVWNSPGTRTKVQMPDRVETSFKESNFLDLVNQNFSVAITQEELAREFYHELQKDVATAFNTTIEGITREEFVQFMVNGAPEQMSLVVPAMTSLADSVTQAADMIDAGLIPSFGFTSAQLMELGSGLEAFNRTTFKVGIVQEIQRLGDVAGMNTGHLQSVLKQMVESISVAGQSFRDVLSDPTKLADLLAEMEFGDINLDQSTQNSFVIRIEAPMDTAGVVATAEALMEEINRRTHEAVSR